MSQKRKLALAVTNQQDPTVVAERLLRKVLPDECYTDLCAKGLFKCIINQHQYTFSRTTKTLVEIEGRTFSCCIEFEQKGPPKADRLAMEYILALNDEAKYLKTANLTDVTPQPRPQWSNTWPNARDMGIDWADERYRLEYERQIRYIRQRQGPRMDQICHQLVVDLALQISNDDRFRGRRFNEYPPVTEGAMHESHQVTTLTVDIGPVPQEAGYIEYQRQFNTFIDRLDELHPTSFMNPERLRINGAAIFDRYLDQNGVHVAIQAAFDIVTNGFMIQLAALVQR